MLLSQDEQSLEEYREIIDRITADPDMVFAFAEVFLASLTVEEAAFLKNLYRARIEHLASKGVSDYGRIVMDMIANDLKLALEKTSFPREEEDAFHEAQVKDFDAKNPLQMTAAEATEALRDFHLLYDPNKDLITLEFQQYIDRIRTSIRVIVPISQDPNLN